ncbi:MAG: response regulator [Lachnospiraceae bacterium]|nr:response regulator [Lachnospiraceae bacterium]
MPGMDGYEVLDSLEADEALKKIPVVFLTGLTDEQEEMRGLTQNVLDYLKKPVGMRVLLMRVRHYLNLIAARSESGSLDQKQLAALTEPLTGRETDVAELMAQFRSDREISEMLNISMPYTKKLVSIVKEKLGLEKRGVIRQYLKK